MPAYKKFNKGNNINSQCLFHIIVLNKETVRFFTEDLRSKGYYCSNNSKEDYNILTSPLAWDESVKGLTGEIEKQSTLLNLIF